MNSKEALKKIYNTGANMVIGTPLDNFFKEEVKAIAKDLEVLEILKRYFNDYHNKTKLLNTFEGKQDYEILEEWLEDENEVPD